MAAGDSDFDNFIIVTGERKSAASVISEEKMRVSGPSGPGGTVDNQGL